MATLTCDCVGFRAYFTWWVTFVQVVYIIAVMIHIHIHCHCIGCVVYFDTELSWLCALWLCVGFRAYFTWWVTFVQVVVYIIAVIVYGFAPIGLEETEISAEVSLHF